MLHPENWKKNTGKRSPRQQLRTHESSLRRTRGGSEWYEDIYDMSPYDIAELFEKTVKEEVGITVTFKAIDLEVSILED